MTLRHFLNSEPNNVLLALQAQRPRAISPEAKYRVLAALPKQDRVKVVSVDARRKIASLEQILSIHERKGIYDIMVIAVPQAFTGLYERAVVVISEKALSVLETAELRAVVAHEVGHEYVWAEYQAASKGRHYARLHELELYCDGIAMLTMLELNEDPRRLTAALAKIGWANERFGLARNQESYPSPAERKRFADAFIRWATKPSP